MMEQIWKITNTNDFVIALIEHIGEKCRYGEDMSALSRPERVFYITQTLEMEVNNGGFSQFFFNSSGDFSGEIVDAFLAICAHKTAEICGKAISAFGQEIPSDRDERQEMMDKCENAEIDEILSECDNAFYKYEEDLNTLNYEYVLKNKASFN